MQEAVLHYVWKFLRFDVLKASTVNGQNLDILNQGLHNTQESGPDFFNAKIRIGDQLWAGNVEIHIKSSDWYAHKHQTDSAYDTVILHVVWEDDVEIFRDDNSLLPTLKLKNLVSASLIEDCTALLENKIEGWINCEASFPHLDSFTINTWLQRLYVERLESKCEEVERLLKLTQNDWEAVLFKMLAKGFGLNVNGATFLEVANSFSFATFRKIQHKPNLLEALLLGQANLLEDREDFYVKTLIKNYNYLNQKFQLDCKVKVKPKFFRLRPHNFPTIRLAQLAALYAKEHQLFSKVSEAKDIKEIYNLFKLDLNSYWHTHYTFSKTHPEKRKPLTKNVINLLIINCIAPVMFAFQKSLGEDHDILFEWMNFLPHESNSIISKFNDLRPHTAVNALESQALIQLKSQYCDKNNCLSCNFGLKVIKC